MGPVEAFAMFPHYDDATAFQAFDTVNTELWVLPDGWNKRRPTLDDVKKNADLARFLVQIYKDGGSPPDVSAGKSGFPIE